MIDNFCECEPGRLHPKQFHDADGCMVTIYKRGKCPCEKSY